MKPRARSTHVLAPSASPTRRVGPRSRGTATTPRCWPAARASCRCSHLAPRAPRARWWTSTARASSTTSARPDGAVDDRRAGAAARARALGGGAVCRCSPRRCARSGTRRSGTAAPWSGSIVHADPASELPALLLCLDGAVGGAASPAATARDPGRRALPGRRSPPRSDADELVDRGALLAAAGRTRAGASPRSRAATATSRWSARRRCSALDGAGAWIARAARVVRRGRHAGAGPRRRRRR